MKAWPVVPLGEVVRHRKEFITIDDTARYKRCRVQLHAQGVLLRDTVSGADIKTKKQQICRTGEFLVAEIDAKMGGFGLVPDELEGAVVSSHYFLFEVDEARLHRRYLDHYCRTACFRSQVEAQGSTNYAAIRPADVMGYGIPLPSLPEQQALAARLDALAEKTQQLEAHLNAAERDAEHLLRTYIFYPPNEQPRKRPMSELLSLRQPDVTVDRTAQYRFAGVYSFGRGVFASVVKTGSEFSYEHLSTIHAEDFTYPKLMAWEGALGVVPAECDGMVVSPEFPVFSVNTEAVLPEVLDIYFRTPEVWPALAELSGGTNLRRRRLQPSVFLNYEMPVPSMATQLKLREIHRYITMLATRRPAIREANAVLLLAMLERVFTNIKEENDVR